MFGFIVTGVLTVISLGTQTTKAETELNNSSISTTSSEFYGQIISCGFHIITNTERSITVPSNTAPKSTLLNITWGAARRKRRRRRRNNNGCPSTDDAVLHLTSSSYFYLNQRSTIEISYCDLTTNVKVVSANNGGSCISWSCTVEQDRFWVENDINVMASVNGIEDGLIYNLTISCNELSTCTNLPSQLQSSVQTFKVVFFRKCTLHVSTSTVSPIRLTTTSAEANICPITDLTVSMTQSVSKLTPPAVEIHTSVATGFSTEYKVSAIIATSSLTKTTLETTNDKMTFGKNAAVSPSATIQMQVYSVSPAVSKSDRNVDNGFLDDPRKKAAVATTSGIIIAIALIVGGAIVSRRFKLCVCVPVVVSPAAEEEQKREDSETDGKSDFNRTVTM